MTLAYAVLDLSLWASLVQAYGIDGMYLITMNRACNAINEETPLANGWDWTAQWQQYLAMYQPMDWYVYTWWSE